MRGGAAAALSALLMALGVAGAFAHGRNRTNDGVPGDFDYYLLSLSWSPAFCLQSPGAAECNGPRRFGFIVHGLWPQNERGWPEYCGGGRVSERDVQAIADLMPARGLVDHEWSAHGSCSGLDPADFFALVRRAYEAVVIPPPLRQPGTVTEQEPWAIAAEFHRANPRWPADSVVATCSRGDTPRLREVHVCFGRDLVPRSCSHEALREACRAPSVLIPPIR